MKKVLIGLVAAVAIAAGGFFGFQFYTQQRIAGEQRMLRWPAGGDAVDE